LSIGILSSVGVGYLRELIHTYSAQHPDVAAPRRTTWRPSERRQLDVAFIVDTTDAAGCELVP
jgi:hypothetical protein